jgi:hypothetical protein
LTNAWSMKVCSTLILGWRWCWEERRRNKVKICRRTTFAWMRRWLESGLHKKRNENWSQKVWKSSFAKRAFIWLLRSTLAREKRHKSFKHTQSFHFNFEASCKTL